MSKAVTYTPEMVTKALAQLVANGGNVSKTAEDLIDDEFQVPVATLRHWKNETHAEQYRRLEERYGKELEELAVAQARLNIELAGQKKRALLNQVPEKPPVDQLAQLLKAVTDAESKGTQGLLQLTGRPTNPVGNQETGEVLKLLQTMADRGYLTLAPGVSVEGPKRVANEAKAS
jgi:hypothetical protein